MLSASARAVYLPARGPLHLTFIGRNGSLATFRSPSRCTFCSAGLGLSLDTSLASIQGHRCFESAATVFVVA